MSTISLGRSGMIGISYKETSLLKNSLKRASEKNNIAINKINRAKLNLQVDRGSCRIRVESDNLQSIYRKLKNNNTDIEKAIKDIDYIVRRFKEVDSKCANKVKLLRTGLKMQKSASKIGSSLISLGDKVVKRTSSFINDGINAAKTMYTKASNWIEKHPLAMNALSALLNTAAVVGAVVSVAGTIAAAVATAPVTLTVGAVVGIVGAVVGGVLALNGLINDGVKMFNNVKNGNNKGFDPIKSGLNKVLGKETGSTVYGVLNVVDLALNIPHAIKGLAKAGTSLIEAGKSIKNTIKELPDIVGNFKGTSIKYMDEVAEVFRKVTGLEPELAGIAGATLDDIKGIGKIKIDDVPELNDLQKNYNKIVNAGEGLQEISEADRLKLSKWMYPPSDELYLANKKVYDDPKYYNQTTGEINWPGQHGDSNIDGFLNGEFEDVSLKPGKKIDRYGGNNGTFFADEGIPTENRAMSPSSDFSSYNVYEIKREIPMRRGEIAPWFDEVGGGIQYQVDPIFEKEIRNKLNRGENFIDGLIRLGYLKRL